MNPSSLRTSSFVAYFSHLPPQEAIERCASLQGATEICSDVDNWKAYVAKRYGLKYSFQRPDLLTAEEWQQQALALEISTDAKINGNTYIAIADASGITRLVSLRGRREYYHAHPDNKAKVFSAPILFVPGIPIVISEANRYTIFYVGSFADRDMGQQLQSIFESPDLSHQWFLELLIPTYSEYVGQGKVLNYIDVSTVAPGEAFSLRRINAVPDNAVNLNTILVLLQELIGTRKTSFYIKNGYEE